jgi:hypothetical protein
MQQKKRFPMLFNVWVYLLLINKARNGVIHLCLTVPRCLSQLVIAATAVAAPTPPQSCKHLFQQPEIHHSTPDHSLRLRHQDLVQRRMFETYQ